MATNPMQRKTRNAFLLGIVVALVIAAMVVALLFMQIKKQNEEIKKYKQNSGEVYVLKQDVKSGQVLTSDMFEKVEVPVITAPDEAFGIANQNIGTVLSQRSFCDINGNYIYYSADGYYMNINGEQKGIYIIDSTGKEQAAKNLTIGDRAYYYENDNNERRGIVISGNAIVSKIDLKKNTVITTSMLTRANEITTNDLREKEYNVISLPVELAPGDYVDIRLTLPNGQDFIVLSKKQAGIPVVNGQYLSDTIKLNITEKELLTLSCAIVENAEIEGSTLYATKYVEAGVQDAASITYRPTDEVIELIANDSNIVNKAIAGLRGRIEDAKNLYGNQDRIVNKVEESTAKTQESRKQYLQSLPVTTY